jgi:hypothetical protein
MRSPARLSIYCPVMTGWWFEQRPIDAPGKKPGAFFFRTPLAAA